MTITPSDVKTAWLTVFPNGHISHMAILGGDCFTMYLQQPRQWINGIPYNDPLQYGLAIDGEHTTDLQLYLIVKTTKPHLVYDHVSIRRNNIKGVTLEKLIKRFQKIRDVVKANKDNLAHEVTL